MKCIGRSGGKSVCATSAYISGGVVTCNHTGMVFDYSKRSDVAVNGILAPKGAPEWALVRQSLWNMVEDNEDKYAHERFRGDRKDPNKKAKSLAARAVQLATCNTGHDANYALPLGLTIEQHTELSERIINEAYVAKGLIVQYAIHNDEHNPHLHLLSTTRALIDGVFSKKRFTFNSQQLKAHRIHIASITNGWCKENNINYKQTALSNAERGSNVIPYNHLGLGGSKLGDRSRIQAANNDILTQNIELLFKDPSEIIKLVSSSKVVFTHDDVCREVLKRMGGDMDLCHLFFEALGAHYGDIFNPKREVSPAIGLDISVAADANPTRLSILNDSFVDTVGTVPFWRSKEDNITSTVNQTKDIKPHNKGRTLASFVRGVFHPLGDIATKAFTLHKEHQDKMKERLGFSKTLAILQQEANDSCWRQTQTQSGGEGGAGEEALPQHNLHKRTTFQVPTHLSDAALKALAADAISHYAVGLGLNLKGEMAFTTHETIAQEDTVRGYVKTLLQDKSRGEFDRTRGGVGVSPKHLHKAMQVCERESGNTFTTEQRLAIAHLGESSRIAMLTGWAGSGKTTVLRPFVDACKREGKIPIGVAFQGKVAELLSVELGIDALTIDKLIYTYNKLKKIKRDLPKLQGRSKNAALKSIRIIESILPTKDHVLILDEGNMVSHKLWKDLLSHVVASGASLRIVQDLAQINAFHGGGFARLIQEELPSVYELKEIFRQSSPWMREASKKFNDHNIEEGLCAYNDHGHVQFFQHQDTARKGLVAAYVDNYKACHNSHDVNDGPKQGITQHAKSIQQHKPPSLMALAFTNADVDALNRGIREKFKANGTLKTDRSILCKGQEMLIGERVLFGKNDTDWFVKIIHEKKDQSDRLKTQRMRGVKNGTIGVLKDFDPNTNTLYIALGGGRLACVPINKYDDITYGYAMTANKAEGQTYDHTYVMPGSGMSANKMLVASTRHRVDVNFFVPKTIAANLQVFATLAGKSEHPALTSDFSVDNTATRAVADILSSMSETSGLWSTMIQASPDDPFNHPRYKDHQEAKAVRKSNAQAVLNIWDQTRPFCNQYGLQKQVLEVYAGLRERPLSNVEQYALERVETYRVFADKVRTLQHTIDNGHHTTQREEERLGLTQELAEVMDKRNTLAFEIAASTTLHKRFFKTTKEDKGYTTYSGTHYNNRPHTLQSATTHAMQHIESGVDRKWIQTLKGNKRKAYQELVAFKHASMSCARLVSKMKQQQTNPQSSLSMPKTQQQMWKQELTKSLRARDYHAFNFVKNFDDHIAFTKDAKVDEVKLLQYAALGELRQHILKHQTTKTIHAKIQRSSKLLGFLEKTQDKRHISILREYNVDITRLCFEAAHHIEYKETGHTRFKTVEALQQAFTALHSFDHPTKPTTDHNDDMARRNTGALEGDVIHEIGEGTQANQSISEQQPQIKAPHTTQTQSLQQSNTPQPKANTPKFHPSDLPLPQTTQFQTTTDVTQNKVKSPKIIQPNIDVHLIEEALLKDMASFADEIFESEGFTYNKMTSSQVQRRYGNKGHIALNTTTGSWIDHKDPTMCGGPLSLLTKLKGMSFKEAITHAASWTGMDTSNPRLHLQQGQAKRSKTLSPDGTNDQEITNKIQRAKLLHQKAVPIQGTLAERYLTQHRKVSASFSSDITFLQAQQGNTQSHPSLMVSARNNAGDITAVQIIALNPQTANKASIEIPKRSHGLVKGSFVTVQQPTTPTTEQPKETNAQNISYLLKHSQGEIPKVLFAAEGIETALSIASCDVAGHIVATLGLSNMKNLAPSKDTTIIIAADHDHKDSPATKTLQKATQHLKDKGYTVIVIKPPTLGHDFNDVLKERGRDVLQDVLKEQLPQALHKVFQPQGRDHANTLGHYQMYQIDAQAIFDELRTLNNGTWHQDPIIAQQRKERKEELIEKSAYNPYALRHFEKNYFAHMSDQILERMESKHMVICIDTLYAHQDFHESEETKRTLETLFTKANYSQKILNSLQQTHPDHHATITQWYTHKEEQAQLQRDRTRGFDMDR